MGYRLSLHDRSRFARNKRERYWGDPAYRLECINRSRARRGMPLLASLEDATHA